MIGKVLSVETRNLSESATADAAIGATTLAVSDASTFDENGGLVTINGDTLAYSAIDVDLDTLTLPVALATAIAENDIVEVYPPAPVKTALVGLDEDGGDSVPATVLHSLLDRLPDGTRDGTNSETVTIEQRGIYELIVTDVLGNQLVQQSLDYVEGEGGYGLDQAVTQMQDAQVLGSFGAAAISADSVSIGGYDLQTQIDRSSIGKLLSARLPLQGANLAITATNTKLFELNCGTLTAGSAGRTYRANLLALLACTGTLSQTDRIAFEFRYTTDGTAPTTGSAEMANSFDDWSYTSGSFVVINASGEVDLLVDSAMRVGLFAQRLSGSGSYSLYAVSSTRSRPVMSLYDDGAAGARQDSALTLTGGGATRFVKTFNPTWAYASCNGNLTTNAPYSDIGNSSSWGNGMFGAFGFNSSAIVAALTGASTPVSCVLKWRPRTRATSSGLDVRFLSHNYTSAAAFTADWFPQQWDNSPSVPLTSLTTFGNAAPGTTYSQSLGTTLFGQFKTGTRKGLCIANSLTPSYNSHPDGTGTFYSFGTYQPQLVFTYDGTS